MKGRYDIIRIPGKNEYLSLCEVEVYGGYIGKCRAEDWPDFDYP